MKLLKTLKTIISLPKVKIEYIDSDSTGELKELYQYFNKYHKKYKIIKNKTIGVMLYKLPKTKEEYEKEISGKNSTGYFSRRCQKLGYYTNFFKQKDYLNDIDNINFSTDERQGRKMSSLYQEKVKEEAEKACIDYFGVFNKDNILVGYARIIKTKKIYIISKFLGHNDYLKDNIMYLLTKDYTLHLIDENKNNKYDVYFMYDTYFGASSGLKLFKKRTCFKPYRVKWSYKKDENIK